MSDSANNVLGNNKIAVTKTKVSRKTKLLLLLKTEKRKNKGVVELAGVEPASEITLPSVLHV